MDHIAADNIIGMMGIINIFGMIAYMDLIAFRLNKKLRKMHIVYYSLLWSFVYMTILAALIKIEGIELGLEQIGLVVLNGMAYFFAFLIIDFVVYFVCVYLYRKFPMIRGMFHPSEKKSEESKEEKKEIVKKHKTKEDKKKR